MTLILSIILCLIITSSDSFASTNLTCKFSVSNDISIVGPLYQCSVDDDPKIMTHDSAQITAVHGNHTDFKSNDNVTGFYAISKTIQHFPDNLDKFLPNLKLICIWSCGLKEIHQNNLKNFPNLIYFDLISNDIEVIEEGLFEFNAHLEAVGLIESSIVHIDPNVFDHLSSLRYLWLGGIPCMDINVNNSSEMIKEALRVLKYNCTNLEVLVLEEELDFLKNEVGSLDFGGKIENGPDFGGKIDKGTYFGGKIYNGTDFGGKIDNGTDFGGKIDNGTDFGGKIENGKKFAGKIENGTNCGENIDNGTNFGGKVDNLTVKSESFAQKYQNFEKSFMNSKFSNFRPLNYKYADLNSLLNFSKANSITNLDTKLAARFDDLKFSQCGVKKFLAESKKSQNVIKNSIQEVKQAQLATMSGIVTSSNEIGKKLNQIQTGQNKIKDGLNTTLNQVKSKVGEIEKTQKNLRLSTTLIEVMINDLKISQADLISSKFDEIKNGQNEIKALVESKLNEFPGLVGELKSSIIEELKPQNAENQENSTQVSLLNELTAKIDDLQFSMTQLKAKNDTLENQNLDNKDNNSCQNDTSDALLTLNATVDMLKASTDDIKAAQETLMSSNDKIQQTLDDLVAKLSENIQSTNNPTQDNEINNFEDKFLIFEEKMSKKFEKNLKEAQERLINKFEEVLEEKLGKILDTKIEKLISRQQEVTKV